MHETINRYLDAAVLYPELERPQAEEAINKVLGYACRTVCIRPCDIDRAVYLCRDTSTAVCAVLNFPHGCGLSEVKAFEARSYLERGVEEIDMVANYGFIRSGEWRLVEEDIRAVADITRPHDVVLKVILETSALRQDQIAQAVACAIAAQADYVKTSTGFGSGGAAVAAVQTMLDAARGRIKVKASGGIRDYLQARAYIDMGVTRLGVGYTAIEAICSNTQQQRQTY
jgi:deoxyribose-phosphate aldolase